MEKTERITVKSVAERWKKQYFRKGIWYNYYLPSVPEKDRKCRKSVYEKLLQAKNLKEVDEIIGNDSWTHTSCHECGARNRWPKAVFDINGGEYDHLLCKPCLQKALTLIT